AVGKSGVRGASEALPIVDDDQAAELADRSPVERITKQIPDRLVRAPRALRCDKGCILPGPFATHMRRRGRTERRMMALARRLWTLGRFPALQAGSLQRWSVLFVGSCVGLLLFVYFALWAFNGFHGLGLDWAGAIALTLGTIVAAGLGVALMGLI